ncbi:MAG: methyltransferase domain-containing protein [bacterium]|nr:methyltransferase domain-containing protein [bacterium]
MPDEELPEHVRENRAYWDGMADDWISAGERSWRTEEPIWGCWQLPESQLGLLPEDMTGLHTIELGCGTGYVSGWMARRGATAVGIDNSERQLSTARRLASEHGVELTLHHGNAETVPYAAGHFDFAISEYGAAIWCDPAIWIPEAHRLLKPGGELVFLGHTPLAMICTPPSGAACEPTLHRDYFGLRRLDSTLSQVDPGGIEFNLPISDWLALFRGTGFEVIDYLELQAPPASPDRFNTPGSWAERWPAEQVWKLRRST